MKNWSYKITDESHPHCGKTLWSGRYCAVTGALFCKTFDGEIWVLAEKRGKGAADFQGKWCLPCGFLECDETGEQGISREFCEETGVIVSSNDWKLFNVQTDPKKCNNGNVTIRYYAYADKMWVPDYHCINGEENEVEEVCWIPLSNIESVDWCFHHDELLEELKENILNDIK